MAEMFQYKTGTNSTIGQNTITHFYDRAGIEAANHKNVYGQFVSKKHMPLHMGKTFKISRWQHIAENELNSAEFQKYGFLSSRNIADVTQSIDNIKLGEGDGAKNLVNFKKVNLECALARYGEMIEYTDESTMFGEDVVQTRYRQELGELANLRMEDLIQREMLATNNVLYSGAATSLATMGTGITADGSLDDQYRISYDLIRKCVRKLKRNRAEKHTALVTGSTKIDTRTVNSAYYAIIGPEVKQDLEVSTYSKGPTNEFSFIPVYKYGAASNLAEGEVGAMHEVRFIESETAMVYRNSGVAVPANYAGTLSYTGTPGNGKFDVFPILFPCKEAFASVGLKGHNKITFKAQSPDEAVSLQNPYGTKGFFSYSFWHASIILQEEKLLKCLVLASA